MKKFLLTALKVLLIVIFVIVVLIYASYKSFKPTVDYIAKLEEIAEEFNKPVDTTSITTTVTRENRDSIIQKFRDVDKDVFTDNKLNYKKMLSVKDNGNQEIILTAGEYAFLKNSIKNCDNFLADYAFDTIIQNSIFMGTSKDRFGEKILIKLDVSELLKKAGLSEIIDNNLYLTITKNNAGLFTYKVNQLDQEKSDTVIQVFNELFSKDNSLKKYTIETLCQKLLEDYNTLVSDFEEFVDICIIMQ